MKHCIGKKTGSVIALVFLFGGCASADPGKREWIGALLGAMSGAAAAANNINKGDGRSLGMAAGALLGYAVGADIGRSLDRANRIYTRRPRGHSQQTPVAGFAPPPKIGRPWFGNRETTPLSGTTRDARDCRALEGGLRPTFACRNNTGQWFVLQ